MRTSRPYRETTWEDQDPYSSVQAQFSALSCTNLPTVVVTHLGSPSFRSRLSNPTNSEWNRDEFSLLSTAQTADFIRKINDYSSFKPLSFRVVCCTRTDDFIIWYCSNKSAYNSLLSLLCHGWIIIWFQSLLDLYLLLTKRYINRQNENVQEQKMLWFRWQGIFCP